MYNVTEGFFFFFVSVYAISYIVLICHSFAKYENTKKLTTCWNFKVMFMAALITYPSCWSIQYIEDIIDSK